MDAVNAANTRELRIADVPRVRMGDVTYYQFVLDARPVGPTHTAALLGLSLFTRNSAFSDADFAGKSDSEKYEKLAADASLRWQLADTRVEIDTRVNAFGEKGDLVLLLPSERLNGLHPETHLYFYAAFERAASESSSVPAEQWAVVQRPREEHPFIPPAASLVHLERPPQVSVPETDATLLLLAAAIGSIFAVRLTLEGKSRI